MLTVRDALNRAYNLLGVGVVAISSLAFFSDLPSEIDQTTAHAPRPRRAQAPVIQPVPGNN